MRASSHKVCTESKSGSRTEKREVASREGRGQSGPEDETVTVS